MIDAQHPDLIDGEPAEVRSQVVADLRRLSEELEPYIEAAGKQIVNAGMTEALEHGAPGADALKVYGVRRPKEVALVNQRSSRSYSFVLWLRALCKAVEDYDADPDAALDVIE